MSKRTSMDADASPEQRRFGLPRLADLRIRSKLGLILIVPVVALLGVASVRLVDSSNDAFQATDAASLAQFTKSSTALLNALQAERAEAAVQLYKDDIKLSDEAESVENFNEKRAETNTAIKAFRIERENLADDAPVLLQTLEDIDSAIVFDLNGFRPKTDGGKWDFLNEKVDPKNAQGVRGRISTGDGGGGDLSSYNAAITFLQTVYEYALDDTADPSLSRELRATQLMASADENSEQLRLLMLNMEHKGRLASEKLRQFNRLVASREQDTLDFGRVASSIENVPDNDPATTLNTGDSSSATNFEDEVVGKSSDDNIDVKHPKLEQAYDARHDASKDFVASVQSASLTDAEAYRSAVVTQVLVEIAAVLITLVVAVLLALAVARRLVQSLRRLREGALEVAHVGLPRAVASMRESEAAAQRTPAQLVAELEDPLRMDNRDEVGTVAGAFNTVHREAVRIAAEQAALRSSVSQMFVNLARRSQGLVDQLIGHLDRLERGEQDPDRLGELFQLDHLATRMRRNDENLLVLAGADSTRVEREPATVGDMLRAAQSEVLSYTRIEFGTILADSDIVAASVNDIVHLVAELLDNATGFSPPDTAVIAEARQVRGEILVRIIDRGIGMTPQQMNDLNHQLADGADVDIAASRLMGLVVVARLAKRHNIKVSLHGERGQGTIAEVVLPSDLLTASTGRGSRAPLASASSPGPRGNGVPPSPTPRTPQAEPSQERGLFEPLNDPRSENVEPFAPAGTNGHKEFQPSVFAEQGSSGLAFHPGGDAGLPRRRLMEVTGEIVSEVPEDPMSVSMPSVRLDASPLPGEAPEIPYDPNKPPQWLSVAGGAPTTAPIAATSRAPAIDETMELPIFREIESAWFKTSTPPPRPAQDEQSGQQQVPPPAAAAGEREPAGDSGFPAAPRPSVSPEPGPAGLPKREPVESTPEPVAEADAPAAPPWQTPADSGWQVAAEVNAKEVEESTESGLPKRRPMERLVPGSVDASSEPEIPKPRRDPEGVRGLLTAYHRGVQRGRGNDAR